MAEQRDAAKAVAVGALTGGIVVGLAKLLEALLRPAEAKPGVQVVRPDNETRQAIASIIALLADMSVKLDYLSDISIKLDDTNSHLADIKAILSGEPIPSEAKYTFRFTTDALQNKLVAGNAELELYQTTAPDKGAILRIKLVSDSADVRYDLYIDSQKWKFNIADMVAQSIDTPHSPGAWLDKATGTEFVFMFSGGESMLVQYWDNFKLVARTTTATAVTIASGEIVEKVLD